MFSRCPVNSILSSLHHYSICQVYCFRDICFMTSPECICVRMCVAARALCVSACVRAYMCAHKGRRLSLIAQAHLLILENRLASYRHKQYKNTQAQTNSHTHTRHKCLPQSLLLGRWTICIHSLAVWTALTGMAYNMDSIVLGQRALHSRLRSHYKTISLYSQGVTTGRQKRACVCLCVCTLYYSCSGGILNLFTQSHCGGFSSVWGSHKSP